MSHIVGIVCEYNPFHNGHKAQIQYAREVLGADYVIAAMSPDFTQRGQVAIFSKYQRTAQSLNYVDMVIEIPVMYATASAEGFATAAITALASTGIVDTILFSSENANRDLFEKISDILINEPEAYKTTIREALAAGQSYPSARLAAVKACIPGPDNQTEELLSKPNNILGLEYVKALKKNHLDIHYEIMERMGEAYHSLEADSYYSSASAIRNAIIENNDNAMEGVPSKLQNSYMKLCRDNNYLSPVAVSEILHYKLLNAESFEKYLDCNEDISNKILKYRNDYICSEQFIDLLKSKDITYSRLSRILAHILLDIRDTDVDYQHISLPYIRVLGIASCATDLFSQMKEYSTVPFFTSVKEIEKAINDEIPIWGNDEMVALAKRQFETDTKATEIYNILLTSKCNNSVPPEISQKFIMV